MGIEIERKFLVVGDGWRQGEGKRYSQGYLNRDAQRTVRVRIAGERAFLTVTAFRPAPRAANSSTRSPPTMRRNYSRLPTGR